MCLFVRRDIVSPASRAVMTPTAYPSRCRRTKRAPPRWNADRDGELRPRTSICKAYIGPGLGKFAQPRAMTRCSSAFRRWRRLDMPLAFQWSAERGEPYVQARPPGHGPSSGRDRRAGRTGFAGRIVTSVPVILSKAGPAVCRARPSKGIALRRPSDRSRSSARRKPAAAALAAVGALLRRVGREAAGRELIDEAALPLRTCRHQGRPRIRPRDRRRPSLRRLRTSARLGRSDQVARQGSLLRVHRAARSQRPTRAGPSPLADEMNGPTPGPRAC